MIDINEVLTAYLGRDRLCLAVEGDELRCVTAKAAVNPSSATAVTESTTTATVWLTAKISTAT